MHVSIPRVVSLRCGVWLWQTQDILQIVYCLIQGSTGFTSGHFVCRQSKGFILCFCTHCFLRAMGKRESDGAPLKRPASHVSSNNGPLLSEAAVEALEATRNINDFRKRARELGFCTAHRNSDGVRCNRSRANILEDCRRRLCRRDINHFRECARVLGVATQHRNAAGHWVNRHKADILEDCRRRQLLSEAAVAELEATRNINDFRKHARQLGFSTHHRNSDGRWCNRSRADFLEACRPVLKK